MKGTAFVQTEDEEVFDLGLHAVGKDEGFSDSVGTVYLFEDVGEWLCFLEFEDVSFLFLVCEQI